MNITTRVSLIVVILGLLALNVVSAQIWKGQGRANGVVVDEDGKPIEGAKVTLSWPDAPGEGPESTVTSRKGKWAVLGLAAGRWNLTIEAAGHITSNGWADVVIGPGQLIRVQLRPLEEVSPLFTAGKPSTIIDWIEKGNSLLDQGRTSEARAEYRKALGALPRERHPELLRTVARTYFLEKQPEEAATTLKQALVIAPGDSVSRQLLLAVLEGLQRGDEARSWLSRLDTEGPEALAAELEEQGAGLSDGATATSTVEPLPTYPPTPGRVGGFQTSFTERSPLSDIQVFLERYQHEFEEIAKVDPAKGAYELANESFELYVPESYRPETPWGLFVWISPGGSGGVGKPENLKVLDEKRLIWIGPNQAGNDRFGWDRVGLALDAVHAMKKLYTIDEERVYVAGYSGGGRVASGVAVLYPEVFQGGFFFYGCDYFRRMTVADKPGAFWPAGFAPPSRAVLKLVRQRNRYVLLTGELDFNRAQTGVYHQQFLKDGFQHVTYLEIPQADHFDGVRGDWLARGIEALDAPLIDRNSE
ncbi:MAG: tetratricopeptide repeat protein [bacterium]|nr:tetratricopeptide repeat protein [bacterium]